MTKQVPLCTICAKRKMYFQLLHKFQTVNISVDANTSSKSELKIKYNLVRLNHNNNISLSQFYIRFSTPTTLHGLSTPHIYTYLFQSGREEKTLCVGNPFNSKGNNNKVQTSGWYITHHTNHIKQNSKYRGFLGILENTILCACTHIAKCHIHNGEHFIAKVT